jgi:hypothetical protein
MNVSNGRPHSDTYARLLEADFAGGDAEYAPDQLLSRGYLYAVDEQLFVTEDTDIDAHREE